MMWIFFYYSKRHLNVMHFCFNPWIHHNVINIEINTYTKLVACNNNNNYFINDNNLHVTTSTTACLLGLCTKPWNDKLQSLQLVCSFGTPLKILRFLFLFSMPIQSYQAYRHIMLFPKRVVIKTSYAIKWIFVFMDEYLEQKSHIICSYFNQTIKQSKLKRLNKS